MSKQSEAKAAQSYRTEPRNCGNCAHRKCEVKLPRWMAETNAARGNSFYTVELNGQETNQCCDLGGFAVKKTATCDRWEKAQGGASHD